MPFESKAQQRFMFARHPKIAKEFAKKTDFSKLPEKKTEKSEIGELKLFSKHVKKMPSAKAKPGSGKRFSALKSKLSHQKGIYNPAGLAAAIGRAKFGGKKMAKFSKKGKSEAGDTCLGAASSNANSALFKEDIPRAIHVGDVFSNKPTMSYTENPMNIVLKRDRGNPLEGPKLESSEDDTLMGRLAKRMASRDYIDKQNLGMGTKVQRVRKVASADKSDFLEENIPKKMNLSSLAKSLNEGRQVEMEHAKTISKMIGSKPETIDKEKGAELIAKDHLKESPKYYEELKKMEKRL